MDVPPKPSGAKPRRRAARSLVIALVVVAAMTSIAMPSSASDCAGSSLTASRKAASVGAMIEIRGASFAECDEAGGCSARVTSVETATLSLHRQPIDSDPTDAGLELGRFPVRDGAFSAVVTIPDVAPGPYVIVATTAPNHIVDGVSIDIEPL